MKRLALFFISLVIFPLISREQVQSVLPVSTAKNGSLTAVAYDWEAIGVNPANLGWQINHKFSFTVLDVGVSGQSEGMNFPTLMNALTSPNLLSSSNSWQQILDAPRGMNANGDINWFAVSFRIPKVPGTFAMNMRDIIEGNAFVGTNTSQAVSNIDNQIYNDQTILSFLNGTTLQYNHYREINIDYGVPLVSLGGVDNTSATDINKCFSFSKRNGENSDKPSFYGGLGFKYIFGIANINSSITNSGINAIYDIDNNYPNIPKGFFNTPGQGYAFDFGLSAIYKRWKFGFSATDMGSIIWKHGAATTADTNVANIRHGSDLINELENSTLPGSKPIPAYSEALPFKMRFGVSYKLNSRILLSSDFVMPLINTGIGLTGPYFALGGQIKLNKYFTVSTGFATARGYGWGIPLGFTFNANKHISFYTGTDDITALMGKPRNADVSAAVALFRYNL